ncbi:hypothetical protein F4778DRAFT_528957 [Xylariomycetidae sp. FL2044]|nr:hypothetical protein F4778DRAFT_528957 [Xylariomycetidae sp. FL2044]
MCNTMASRLEQSSQQSPPRLALRTLTINTRSREGGKHFRISKPHQPTQTRTHRTRQGRQTEPPRRMTLQLPPRRITLQLPPDQHARASIVFNAVRSMPQLANRTPRACPSEDAHSADKFQLEVPKYCTYSLLGDWRLPALTARDIQDLRDASINDIRQLYDRHLPYVPDLTTLKVVVSKTMPRVYRAFINTFDFSIELNDHTIPWAEITDARIQRIERQFDVLEALAVLAQRPQPGQLSVDLQPSISVQILKHHRPPPGVCNLLVRHLKAYSAKLGKYVVKLAYKYMHFIPGRSGPPFLPLHFRVSDYISTVTHVLHLLDQSLLENSHGDDLATDRAALLVIHATLLIHQHAKTIPLFPPCGLLRCIDKDASDAYMTFEGFLAAAHARDLAETAIGQLPGEGAELLQKSDEVRTLLAPPRSI